MLKTGHKVLNVGELDFSSRLLEKSQNHRSLKTRHDFPRRRQYQDNCRTLAGSQSLREDRFIKNAAVPLHSLMPTSSLTRVPIGQDYPQSHSQSCEATERRCRQRQVPALTQDQTSSKAVILRSIHRFEKSI